MNHKMFKIVALFLALIFPSIAFASTCFWVPIVVSGAVSGTGSVCRLTITAITGSGLVAGDSVVVAGLVGATECNGTTTISTVVDSTHIELTGTTFTSAYVSGGTVAGGHWTTTNTAMWASGTGGTVGTCAATGGVPKQAADNATWDGSSGGGTVVVDSTINGITLNQITAGAFNGTLTFAVNNPSITVVTQFSISGSGTRTINMGTGTFTLNGIGGTAAWDAGTVTGLVSFSGGSATFVMAPNTGLSSQSVFNTGGQTYGTLALNGPGSNGYAFIINNTGATFTNFNITGPATLVPNTNFTITNAVNWAGSSSNLILVTPPLSNGVTTITLNAAGGVASWAAFRYITFASNSLTATNSFNLGAVTNATITNPSGSGGGGAPPMFGGT